MRFLSLIGIEAIKIRRSKITGLLAVATVILWLPSVLNADMNFGMQAEGILPEYNFFIQGFMAMTWFLFPASMVVGTVLLNMTECGNRGILKMLSLPVDTTRLCLAKFVILVALSALQILMAVGMYYVSAWAASGLRHYSFVLPPLFVCREACKIFLASIPMLAFFWFLAVWIQTPIFAIGIGFAAIVPSVLVINTKIWFAYPVSYPFFVLVAKYGKLAAGMDTAQVELFPWLPVAGGITVFCLLMSCLCFGQAERRAS